MNATPNLSNLHNLLSFTAFDRLAGQYLVANVDHLEDVLQPIMLHPCLLLRLYTIMTASSPRRPKEMSRHPAQAHDIPTPEKSFDQKMIASVLGMGQSQCQFAEAERGQ